MTRAERASGEDVSFALPSGLVIPDALGLLLHFCAEEFEYYDAIPSGSPNEIDPVDVLATVSVNSFVNDAARVRRVHRGLAEKCNPILARIPTDADLRTHDLDILRELLDAAVQARGVLIPVPTKVLHRKRRHLIPMLDRVVNKYYLDALGQGSLLGRLEDKRQAAGVAMLIVEKFREDLLAAWGGLTGLADELGHHGFPHRLYVFLNSSSGSELRSGATTGPPPQPRDDVRSLWVLDSEPLAAGGNGMENDGWLVGLLVRILLLYDDKKFSLYRRIQHNRNAFDPDSYVVGWLAILGGFVWLEGVRGLPRWISIVIVVVVGYRFVDLLLFQLRLLLYRNAIRLRLLEEDDADAETDPRARRRASRGLAQTGSPLTGTSSHI